MNYVIPFVLVLVTTIHTFVLGQDQPEEFGTIVFYEDSYHKGEKWTAYVLKNTCYNFQKYFNDKASSVNTNDHCIILYEHGDCKGSWERLAPTTSNHENLDKLKFNDVASSFKLCPDELRVRTNITEIPVNVSRCRMVCE